MRPTSNLFTHYLPALTLLAVLMTSISAAWCAAGKETPVVSKDGGSITLAGSRYLPIDDAGVYYYDAASVSGVPMPAPREPLSKILDRHGFHGMLRCELVDYVDCARTDHGFVDDGKSRVVELGDGQRYRLTAAEGSCSWYAYFLKTRPQPGRPHLIVVQTINDIERYTTVTTTVPKGKPWAAPYSGEELVPVDCQEDNWYNPDVGGTIYTGREYPTDGKPLNYMFLYYPKAAEVKVTISHQASEEKLGPNNGAAVARIWIFDVIDPLGEARVRPTLTPDPSPSEGRGEAKERRLALYVPHPWFLYSHYGTPATSRENRIRGLKSFVEYLQFCGFNQVQLHIINGSDTAGRAWYDSKLYKPFDANLFDELVPIAAQAGIEVVPIVTPIFVPKYGGDLEKIPLTPDENGFSRLSLQLDRDGKTYTNTMGQYALDPLRPEVQEWMFKCLREVAERAAKHPNVPGVGFRVNGKLGTCYVGFEAGKCGQDTGYSEWDIAEFEKDTGIGVPDNLQAYDWLRANAWEKWIDWRCRRTHDFWLKARDTVRSYRQDMELVVACDLPSEYPGYNIEWVNGVSPRDLMRHHGYDPEMFRSDDGILIQRGMMIGSDRYFGKWGPPHGTNAWAHKAFNYADGVVECYRTPAGQAVEFYHNYWEEVPHPDPEYGTTLRTSTAAPPGQFYFEPATYSLRKANVHTMAYMGWERASIGHESDLRRFARAYRALPCVDPKDFEGRVEVLSTAPGAKYRKPEEPDVWVKWFGDRLAVVNDTGSRKYVLITIPKPLAKGSCLFDLAAGRILVQADRPMPSIETKLLLLERDLHTLAIMPLAEAQKLSAKALPVSTEPGRFRMWIEGPAYSGQDVTLRFSLANNGKSPLTDAQIDVTLPRNWKAVSSSDDVSPGLPVMRTAQTIAPGKSIDYSVRLRIPHGEEGNPAWFTGTAVYSDGGREVVSQKSLAAVPELSFGLAISPERVKIGVGGKVVDFELALRNKRATPLETKLDFRLPDGWTLISDALSMSAGAQASGTLDFKVVVPETVGAGKYKIGVSARPDDDVSAYAECDIEVAE